MNESIGYQGTGAEVEFRRLHQTHEALKVQVLFCGTILWIPKSSVENGILTELGGAIFRHNYRKASGRNLDLNLVRKKMGML